MKTKKILTLCIILLVTAIFCSQSPIEAGDDAFANENYGEALRQYFEALKNQPDNQSLKGKIAVAYFKQGGKIYNRGKVIRAFEDRVQKGLNYLPDTLSGKMKEETSQVYLQLAAAYRYATPENPYQKRKYFDQTLANLKKALAYDSTNWEAKKALDKFQDEHFQEMMDQGIAHYKKGTDDALQYLAAEYYLKNALKMNPKSDDAARYLTLTRKKALNLLDPGQQAPVAITDRMENEEYKAYLVVLLNQTQEKLSVKVSDFYLVSKDGEKLQGQTSEMFSNLLKPGTLSNGAETSGVVAFPRKSGNKFTRLEFRKNGEVLGYKNLP